MEMALSLRAFLESTAQDYDDALTASLWAHLTKQAILFAARHKAWISTRKIVKR